MDVHVGVGVHIRTCVQYVIGCMCGYVFVGLWVTWFVCSCVRECL